MTDRDMEHEEFKIANDLFLRGEAISDGQLNILIRIYKNTLDCIDLFGAEFNLAGNEIRRRLYTLESFFTARKEK